MIFLTKKTCFYLFVSSLSFIYTKEAAAEASTSENGEGEQPTLTLVITDITKDPKVDAISMSDSPDTTVEALKASAGVVKGEASPMVASLNPEVFDKAIEKSSEELAQGERSSDSGEEGEEEEGEKEKGKESEKGKKAGEEEENEGEEEKPKDAEAKEESGTEAKS